MSNEEDNSIKRIFLQELYDNLNNNESVSLNAGDIVKEIALNSEMSIEKVTEVIKSYLKIIIYSGKDSPDFDENTSYLIFSHLDELDRIELTYFKDKHGKPSVGIGLLREVPKKKLYS